MPNESPSPPVEASSPPSREALVSDLALAREAARRLEAEVRRLEVRLSQGRAESVSLRHQLEERERYVAAIHGSLPWRLAQALRGLVGRRW